MKDFFILFETLNYLKFSNFKNAFEMIDILEKVSENGPSFLIEKKSSQNSVHICEEFKKLIKKNHKFGSIRNF
jgi:hypothetical protein